MQLKSYLTILLMLVLISGIILSGCDVNVKRQESVLKDYLEKIDKGTFEGLTLTIYYLDPMILTRTPLSIEGLIDFDIAQKFTVNSSELKEHIDVLKKLQDDELKPVKKASQIDARVYYVFENDTGDIILDVAMWGEDYSIFVNGLEVEWNDIFFDLISPFLPEEAIDELESYISDVE